MMLTRSELHEIADQLPPLIFSAQGGNDWVQSTLVQTYLSDYGINFTQEFPQLTHNFGCINAAGFKIAAQYWLPQNAQGTLVLVHGYYDHVGVFDHPIRFALHNNLAVITFDLPGHGLSSGEQAAINSFDQYADVLAEILRKSAGIMKQPVYALGQSTGCAVIMNYLWRYAAQRNALEQFSKIAFCSPLVLPRGWRGLQLGSSVYAVLRHFVRQIPRTFSQSSHDQKFNRFLKEQDPLQAHSLPLSWVGAMKSWHQTLLKLPPTQNNCLIVQGTADMTVEWQYNLPLLQQKLPQAKMIYVKDAGHQLVNESPEYRDQVFAAIENYFFNS